MELRGFKAWVGWFSVDCDVSQQDGALCKVEVAGLWLSRGGRGVEPLTLLSDCMTKEVTVPMVSVDDVHRVAGTLIWQTVLSLSDMRIFQGWGGSQVFAPVREVFCTSLVDINM